MKNYMLVSCPKSGTDFLMKGLLTNKTLKYHREFFHPLSNDNAIIKANFGTPWDTLHLASDRPCPEAIEYFNTRGLNITKEVHLSFRLEHFKDDFEFIFLHRSRSLTFPSTIPIFLECIGVSFLENTYDDAWYKEIQDYLRNVYATDTEYFPVLSHVLNWYVTFKFCEKYELPVIEYSMLMTLDEDALSEYLSKILPKDIYRNSIPRRLIQIRKDKPRPNMTYTDLNVEFKVQEFIEFLKTGPDYPNSFINLLDLP